MKTAQGIPSQTSAPADATIANEQASASSSAQENLFDGATETTPLHSKQLQQFLQQLNWQEQNLAVADISSTLLAEELNRSWYSRLNYLFLREPLLFKILQWPFSKRWPSGSVFSTDDEHLLKRVYGVNGYLEGTDLMLNKVWSSLLLSFLIVDIANYYLYPNLRYGNTLLKVFLAQTDNQQMLSNVLTLPEAWPILLGMPILWGILKAFLNARHAKALDKATYRTLLETLGHYQASLWKDIGRWVLPSLLPEFVPNLALFALLPEPKLKLALESAERLLLWDRRIIPKERRKLLQQVQVLTRKATHMTQLKALATLAKVADGIAPNDLVRLSQQEVDAETLKSLLWVKQQAKQTLQQVAQSPSTLPLLSSARTELLINLPLDDKFATPSGSRYLYTHYLLWTLGQPHDYRLQPLFWSYLAFHGYFKMRFFYLLGRGMYDTFSFYWDRWQCENKGRLWIYLDNRADWECTVCGDLPLFYRDIFTDKDCWDAYLKNPRPVDQLVALINRLNFTNIPTIDLSAQSLTNEDLVATFAALESKAQSIQALWLNSIIATPLNKVGVKAIANFLRYAPVTELNLSSQKLQDNDTYWLAQILATSKIKSLYLYDNLIADIGAKALGEMLNHSKIQSLDLSSNNIGDEGTKGLAQGLPGSQVQVLDLSFNSVGAEGTKELAQGLLGSQVQVLDLSFNSIGAEGAKGLAPGLPSSQVQFLDLDSNSIGAEGAKELAQGLPRSQVQFLDLSNNNISDGGVTGLGQALNRSQIQHLDLSSNNIGAEGAKGLTQGLPGSQVQFLFLSSNSIGDEGAKELARGLPRSQVQFLDLSFNSIGAEGAKGLAQGLPGSQVQFLFLSSNSIGAEGAKELALGLPGSHVKSLGLTLNSINDKGAKEIGQLLNRSQVQYLYLSSNSIGAEGAKELALGLPHSQVRHLDLNSNSIGDEGAKGLGQGLPDSNVYQLYLNNSNIGDEGAKGLAQGLPGSQVEALYLSSNHIGDEGTKGLAQGLLQIQVLYLSGNRIGAEGAKELAQGLPGSHVQHLDLSSNNIGAEGARGLGQGLPGSNVQQLYLNNNSIGAEGAKELVQGLSGSQVQFLDLSFNSIGAEGSLALANTLIKSSLYNHDLASILTPDAKKALARAEPNTPLEKLLLSSNKITTQGARALCLALPQTYINQFSLDSNPINSSQVDPLTCFISSSTASLQPTGPYVTLYHLCQATLRYAMEGYQYIAAHWLTLLSLSPAHNKTQNQFSSLLDPTSNTVKEIALVSPDFSPEGITINESPIINAMLPEINENEPLFTFKIPSTTFVESAMDTASSSLLEPTNRTSKNPFSFFNTLAKTSLPASQALNSNIPVLPKPAETVPTVSALGAVGAVVTGLLAVGYWAWKNISRNNTIAAIPEKTDNFQSEVKASN
jgi:Ran GTPase-activating protein (RanGAP) involved in mRNA processing and transport